MGRQDSTEGRETMQRAYFDFKQNRSYMAFDNKTDNIIVVWPSIEEGKFYVQFLAEDDNVFEHNEKPVMKQDIPAVLDKYKFRPSTKSGGWRSSPCVPWEVNHFTEN